MNTLPNPIHGDWTDSMADWAMTHQPLSEHDVDRFIADRIAVPHPAEACSVIGAEPENLSGLPLEPLLARHAWLGPLLLVLVVLTWLCFDGYIANLP